MVLFNLLLCAKCIYMQVPDVCVQARGTWYNSSVTLSTFLSTFMTGVVAHTPPRIWETEGCRQTSEFEAHLLYMASLKTKTSRFTFIGGGHAYHMWSGGTICEGQSSPPRSQESDSGSETWWQAPSSHCHHLTDPTSYETGSLIGMEHESSWPASPVREVQG